MLSNNPYNYRKAQPYSQDTNLIATRSASLYGLKYEKVKKESSSYKRGIVITPNFYFYQNDTKVMIDFSDYKNTIKGDVVEEFFNLTLKGETLTISQGQWINPQLSKTKVSLDGTYTINEYVNNILFVDVVSIKSFNTYIKRYDKNYFTYTPNFDIIYTNNLRNLESTAIVNVFGKNSKNSFSYLGISKGDYVTIQQQKTKYLVQDLKIDDEGKEILTIEGIIAEEDRISKLTNVSVFNANLDNTDITQFSNEKIGRCNVLINDIPTCFNNQSELQCQLRKNSKFEQTSNFSEGNYCPEIEINLTQQRTSNIDILTKVQRDTNFVLQNSTRALDELANRINNTNNNTIF